MDRQKPTAPDPAAAPGGKAGAQPTGAAAPADPPPAALPETAPAKGKGAPKEVGGPAGPEPTRYGDWEIKGRCIDF